MFEEECTSDMSPLSLLRCPAVLLLLPPPGAAREDRFLRVTCPRTSCGLAGLGRYSLSLEAFPGDFGRPWPGMGRARHSDIESPVGELEGVTRRDWTRPGKREEAEVQMTHSWGAQQAFHGFLLPPWAVGEPPNTPHPTHPAHLSDPNPAGTPSATPPEATAAGGGTVSSFPTPISLNPHTHRVPGARPGGRGKDRPSETRCQGTVFAEPFSGLSPRVSAVEPDAFPSSYNLRPTGTALSQPRQFPSPPPPRRSRVLQVSVSRGPCPAHPLPKLRLLLFYSHSVPCFPFHILSYRLG